MHTFFTSDFHFGHTNIIKYCNRPFSNVKEMDEIIIRKFNERVKEGDMCFFLGDFCFKSGTGRGEGEPNKAEYYRKQLNCKNIVFISGNHDGNNSLKTCIQKIVITLGGKRINLTHNPEFVDTNYEFNIVGHVHEKWQFKRIKKNNSFTDCCNVSVEQWGYSPIDINEIFVAYATWKKAHNG